MADPSGDGEKEWLSDAVLYRLFVKTGDIFVLILRPHIILRCFLCFEENPNGGHCNHSLVFFVEAGLIFSNVCHLAPLSLSLALSDTQTPPLPCLSARRRRAARANRAGEIGLGVSQRLFVLVLVWFGLDRRRHQYESNQSVLRNTCVLKNCS